MAANVQFEELKERFDLLSEMEKDLGPGRKSGRWVFFSCPFPGHKHGDRKPALSVTPETGVYYCFACGATGDVITWLREYREMDWKDIFALADDPERIQPARKAQPVKPQPEPISPPSPTWQARGLEFVAYCEQQLWSDRAGPVFPVGGERLTPLEYLRRARGLTDATIRRYRLGYCPKPVDDSPARWGFDLGQWVEEHAGKKYPDKLWLPQGITIPCLVENELWSVNTRRPAGNPKYLKISGSKAALFGAENLLGAEVVLLVEGEFDCMLADQQVGDVAGVATLGSASKRLDAAHWHYLLPARAILAALDIDEAGQNGLSEIAGLSPQIYPVRVPALRAGDKDLTDYHLAGGDLWEWLKYSLHRLGVLEALGVVYDQSPEAASCEVPALSEVQAERR